jgi:hypothetical protein
MIFLVALVASILRWLTFPVYDYPDAEYIYPRSPFYSFLQPEDHALASDFAVLPSGSALSLFTGSIYDSPFDLPSLKYWLISSTPFLVFAIFAQGYIWLLAKKNSKGILKKSLILFAACPSSAYYLCTLHPESWASVVALGYIVSLLDWIASMVNPVRTLKVDTLHKQPPLGTFLLFLVLLVSGVYELGDYQFILCTIGISWIYACLRLKDLAIVNSSIYLLQAMPRLLKLKAPSVNKLLTVSVVLSTLFVIVVFAYPLRALIASPALVDARITSALSLYGIGSIYADKYPLIARPLLTINGIFVYTPAEFGPSVILKIACIWSILLSWLQAITGFIKEKRSLLSSLMAGMAFSLLFPIPITFLLPGYVNLKYYIFLLPVLLFWPAVRNFRSLKILFAFLWLELGLRSLVRVL